MFLAGNNMSDNREKKDTDMNQSFAQFAEQAEKDGHVYIYKDNGTTYKMIMDRNLGNKVAYNSDNINNMIKKNPIIT